MPHTPRPPLPGVPLARRVLALTPIVAAALAVACGETPEDPDDPGCVTAEERSDFAFVRDEIFAKSCAAFSACHRGAAPGGDLDLTAALAHGQLVDVPSSAQPGAVRVVPGDPSRSYLLVKLGEVNGPREGDLMPPNGLPLCAAKRAAVRRWIEAGASADGAGG